MADYERNQNNLSGRNSDRNSNDHEYRYDDDNTYNNRQDQDSWSRATDERYQQRGRYGNSTNRENDFDRNNERPGYREQHTDNYGQEGYRGRQGNYAGRDTNSNDWNDTNWDRSNNRHSRDDRNYSANQSYRGYTQPYMGSEGAYGGSYYENQGYGNRQGGSNSGGIGNDYSSRSGASYSGGSFGTTGMTGSNSGQGGSYSNDRYGSSRQEMGVGQHKGKGPKGYSRSDDRIKEDINDRLSDDEHLDASDIEVEVKNGEVRLTGTVDNRVSKRRAEDIADAVSGVQNVENGLRVKQGQSNSSSSTDNNSNTSSGKSDTYQNGTHSSKKANV